MLKRLVFKHFVEVLEFKWKKKPIESWKVDYGVGSWLNESKESDWNDIIDIAERINYSKILYLC